MPRIQKAPKSATIEQDGFSLRPLKEDFAAIVSGIDLAFPPGSGLQERVRALHRDYPVLAFAEQNLEPNSFRAFSRIFGELEIDEHLTQFADPEFPEIIYLANYDEDGKPDPASADRGSAWHTDSTYKQNPCAHTILYALEVPATGGGTIFADMYRAYDTLPEEVKVRIEDRVARHLFGGGPASGGIIPLNENQKDLLPTVEQPVVLSHPDTGRKALYVNPLHTVEILGMDRQESDALLGFIFEHATGPDFIYHHLWQAGQLVVWDQRCTMHRAEANYPMHERRRLMRTKVCGTL